MDSIFFSISTGALGSKGSRSGKSYSDRSWVYWVIEGIMEKKVETIGIVSIGVIQGL